MNDQKLIDLAIELGATKAAVVAAESVVLSASFRDICEGNGCGNYGKCYMCPPDVGDIDPLMAKVKTYQKGLFYQTIHTIEDSFDIEGMLEAGKEHMRCSQRIEAEAAKTLTGGYLHLSAGGCRLCDECAKRENSPCRYPDRALPSLESYGVDVYQTAAQTPLKYINGQDTVTFFGMVLYMED